MDNELNLDHVKNMEFVDYRDYSSSFSEFIENYISEWMKILDFQPPILTTFYTELHNTRHLHSFRFFIIINFFNLMILFMELTSSSDYSPYIHISSSIAVVFFHALILFQTLKQKKLFNFANYSIAELLCVLLMIFYHIKNTRVLAVSLHVFNFNFLFLISTLLLSKMHFYQSFLYSALYFLSNNYIWSANYQPKYLFAKHVDFFLHLCLVMLTSSVSLQNDLRKRSTFVRMVRLAKAKEKLEKQASSAHVWIEAIMPKTAAAEYEEMCSLNRHKPKQWWLYIRSYENVSILFADIVGFTKMSSNKTPFQIVRLLNDLFQRFDILCQQTRCEKLGTLGDCYYCLAGCPVPQADHAKCCIEMGLGMCRTIKMFNNAHNESVNMRVGIHTGRVNAGIIGKLRFRYDAYSNDVIIANLMESSGRPGRVHVSETTLNEALNDYNFGIGEIVNVMELVDTGRGVKKPVSRQLKTYYVDPRSVQTKHNNSYQKIYQMASRSKFLKGGEPRKTSIGEEDYLDSISSRADTENYCNGLYSDLNIISRMNSYLKDMFEDVDKVLWNKFTLVFDDCDAEWNYQFHLQGPIKPVNIDSLKLIRVVFFSVHVLCGLILGACVMYSVLRDMVFVETIFYSSIFLLYMLAYCLVFQSMLWTAFKFSADINTSTERRFFIFLLNPIVRELTMLLIGMLHIAWALRLFSMFNSFKQAHDYCKYLFLLQTTSLMLSASLPYSKWYVRFIEVIFKQIAFCTSHLFKSHKEISSEHVRLFTPGIDDFTAALYFYLLTSTLVTFLISYHREKNDRNCFNLNRETAIALDHSKMITIEAERFLHNIIPSYVLDHLGFGLGHKIDDINYAVKVDECGVIFACISNFFSSFYKEDYRGGEEALKLLNRIICTFDSLISKYSNVEKIKTINDNYMAAAGLNMQSRNKNEDKDWHLIELMFYCFDLRDALNQLNQDYVFGEETFKIKIGYNIGNLTAGIIGNVKPLYDIWGDTVNVASRMYSTADGNTIQVPKYVATRLSGLFEFTYRGSVFVKGKGNMDTYEAVRPLRHFNSYRLNSNESI